MNQYQIIQNNKNILLEKFKEKKYLNYLLDACSASVRDQTDFEIKYILDKFYDKLKPLENDCILLLNNLNNIINNAYLKTITEYFLNKLKEKPDILELLPEEDLAWNRSFEFIFSDRLLEDYKIDSLLRASNGVTPSLYNSYNYRVNVMDKKQKEMIFKASINLPDEGDEWEIHNNAVMNKEQQLSYLENVKINYNVPKNYDDLWKNLNSEGDRFGDIVLCFNPQVLSAPLVLCYSIPQSSHYNGFESKHAIIASSFSVWSTLTVAHQLGLAHSFCCALDFDLISQQFLLKDENNTIWNPILFLCFGYSKGRIKTSNHREYKHNNILNVLKFNG